MYPSGIVSLWPGGRNRYLPPLSAPDGQISASVSGHAPTSACYDFATVRADVLPAPDRRFKRGACERFLDALSGAWRRLARIGTMFSTFWGGVMKRLSLFLSLVLAALLFVPVSHAARFSVNLSGPAESPPNSSLGSGSGFVDLDPILHTLRVSFTFSGLTGNTTASHIHCCVVPNGTAGVATTTPTFPGFPLGVTSGSYDVVLDMTQASSWNPAFITAHGGTPAGAEAALSAGIAATQAYLNVHTSTVPGGEIRGFLIPVTQADIPTLAEWAVGALAVVLLLLGMARIRRRAV
jgi:hypothetical protein